MVIDLQRLTVPGGGPDHMLSADSCIPGDCNGQTFFRG